MAKHRIGEVLEFIEDKETEEYKKEICEQLREIVRETFREYTDKSLVEMNCQLVAQSFLVKTDTKLAGIVLSEEAEEKFRELKRWLMEKNDYFVKYAEPEDLH